MALTRRRFVQATGAGFAVSALGLPAIVRAQSESIRLGLMTVKTGPLASGGIDMERALIQFLRERDNTLAGRKVELFVGDSARRAGTGTDQAAGARRARQDSGLDRASCCGRSARRRRLHPSTATPDAVGCRRRGPDAAQSQRMVRSRHVDLLAMRPAAGGLLLSNAQVPAHGDHRRRHRLRSRNVRGLPARIRGCGREDRAKDVPSPYGSGLRDLPRATQDEYRWHFPWFCRFERISLV